MNNNYNANDDNSNCYASDDNCVSSSLCGTCSSRQAVQDQAALDNDATRRAQPHSCRMTAAAAVRWQPGILGVIPRIPSVSPSVSGPEGDGGAGTDKCCTHTHTYILYIVSTYQ